MGVESQWSVCVCAKVKTKYSNEIKVERINYHVRKTLLVETYFFFNDNSEKTNSVDKLK